MFINKLIVLGAKCDGESECTIHGNMNGVLGDPCFKNHKYLSYEYECDYSSSEHVASFCEVQMENRTMSFECSDQKTVKIIGATWGRSKDQL